MARRNRILDAATKLFVSKGYDHTKAEDIAELAEVSTGTLYNYFDSKGEILLTLVTLENEQIVDLGDKLIQEAKGSAADVYCALFDIYFDPEINFLNKEAWRLGFAFSFLDVRTEGARKLRELDRRQAGQVVELTRKLKRCNAIIAEVESEIFGQTLFNNANMMFIEFSRSENMTMVELRNRVQRMTKSLVSLAVPKSATGRLVEG